MVAREAGRGVREVKEVKKEKKGVKEVKEVKKGVKEVKEVKEVRTPTLALPLSKKGEGTKPTKIAAPSPPLLGERVGERGLTSFSSFTSFTCSTPFAVRLHTPVANHGRSGHRRHRLHRRPRLRAPADGSAGRL